MTGSRRLGPDMPSLCPGAPQQPTRPPGMSSRFPVCPHCQGGSVPREPARKNCICRRPIAFHNAPLASPGALNPKSCLGGGARLHSADIVSRRPRHPTSSLLFDHSTTPAGRAAGVAFQAGAVPNHGEVAAFAAAFAFVALEARFGGAEGLVGDEGARLPPSLALPRKGGGRSLTGSLKRVGLSPEGRGSRRV